MDERRTLTAEERAILDWFFDQWPELAPIEDALPPNRVADVFAAEDGYRTLELAWAKPPIVRPSESPFRGEARCIVDGKHFEAMLFTSDAGAMLELIWSPEWPGRLPRPEELEAVWKTDADVLD